MMELLDTRICLKTVLALSISVIACAMILGCISDEMPGKEYASEEFNETYQVGAGTVLSVEGITGGISVTSWDRDSVEVYALKKTEYGEDELDKAEIEAKTGKTLSIKTIHRENSVRVSINYEIKIPSGMRVEQLQTVTGSLSLEGSEGNASLVTITGSITVRSVDGCIQANTVTGDIDVKNITGILGAEVVTGDIEIEIPAITDNIKISCTTGSIEAYVSPSLNTNLYADVVTGKVEIHGLQITVKESSKTRVEGTLGNGGHEITLKTSTGNIDLYSLE